MTETRKINPGSAPGWNSGLILFFVIFHAIADQQVMIVDGIFGLYRRHAGLSSR